MDTGIKILRLNTAGYPVEWLNWQEAACLYSRNKINWSIGENVFSLRGGISRKYGCQSQLMINSIIACEGRIYTGLRKSPPLTNKALFRRDQNICMYCGKTFSDRQLTRDHVIPVSKGGLDIWTNVVAACKRCNQLKGDKLLNEQSLQLIALPYCPNTAEYLALTNNSRILGDQMEFLKAQFSKNWLSL